MEYTIQKLAQLAGVSTRTLRYYDEVGILKPAELIHRVIEFMERKRLINFNRFCFIEPSTWELMK